MAKYEKRFQGDFVRVLDQFDRAVLEGSFSASLEDGSDMSCGQARCAVRVYERYSALGGNRVSLNLTLVGEDGRIFVSAITSGGSQAIFFKINTLGEGAFLDRVQELLDQWHG